MTRRIAREALIALEFRGLPFHDPFHGPAVDRRWPPQDQGRSLAFALWLWNTGRVPFDQRSLGYEHYNVRFPVSGVPASR